LTPEPARAGRTQEPDSDVLVELNALLGRGTRYSGKLHFEGRIRIEGQFDGEIRGEDVLVIGPGAEVSGSIEVGVCIVMGGEVHANIRAWRAIELHAPAVVQGDLHAPNVFIDRGVQFEGKCKMAPLDADDGTAPASPSGADVVAQPLPDGAEASPDGPDEADADDQR
jgi:cytoskeletal protein CcmA (bactofilin family)